MSKVVVLDDNEVMRSVLSDIVSYMGHEVMAFERVAPFMASVQSAPPDYVIVDANLQDEANGLEVIEQVRNMPGMQDLRYILITANSAIAPLRQRLEQRQIEFLSKPCSFDDLAMALN